MHRMPNTWLFGVALVIIGVSAITFSNATNSLMQLSTDPVMRGRVMAIRLAVALGGTPIGAPIVGWAADRFGRRWALGVGAAAGFAAALVGVHYLAKHRHLRLRLDAGLGGLQIADLADHDHIGVVAQERSQRPRKVQSDAGLHLHLLHPAELIFDWILDRHQLALRRIEHGQRRGRFRAPVRRPV